MASEERVVKEEVPELLFTLASADRLALLSEIAVKKQNLTGLSKAINASRPEGSRHLARLKEAGLIVKDSEGFYRTTSIGEAMLKVLPSVQFLLEHRNNLESHDLSGLPVSFVERIGDLAGGESVRHFNQAMELVKTVSSEAKEFLWGMGDEPLGPVAQQAGQFLSRTLAVRLITGQKIDGAEFRKLYPHRPERFELATLQNVKVGMSISETLAWVNFMGPDGKIDHSAGFYGRDARFRGWCSDLFEYFWAKSMRVPLY